MFKFVLRGFLITIAAALILLLLFRNRLPFGGSNSSYAAEPANNITRIEFSEKNDNLILEKKGDSWAVNNKAEARKSGILFILRILHEIKIKSPVSEQLFRSEITDKGIEPVKIRVYEGRKLLRSFLVYKTTSNIYGNIMKIRERSKPFIVYLPGYDGDIGSAFTLNELFWQPYTVFNLLPSEIESVKFENFTDTASSFLITGRNHGFTLSAMNRKLEGWDSTLVIRYLSSVAWIPFEKWALNIGAKEKKSLKSKPPVYRITVTSAGGKKSVLTLWELMKEGQGDIAEDSDRLLGKTQSGNDFFVMRYFDIDPLLKKRSYFFPE